MSENDEAKARICAACKKTLAEGEGLWSDIDEQWFCSEECERDW